MLINTSVSIGKLKVISFILYQRNFGESIGVNQVDRLESIFKDKHKKLLCVNDDVDFKEENIIRFKEILKERYPENQLLKNEK